MTKQEKRERLLNAVKPAVARYGMDRAGIRAIGKFAGVNGLQIFRFFRNREALILEAYKKENGPFIHEVAEEISYLHLQDTMSFQECVRRIFQLIWSRMTEDLEFCRFVVNYYHSSYFTNAFGYYEELVEQLADSAGWLFRNRDGAKRCIYSLLSLIYDFCGQVADGRMENSPENMKMVCNMFCNILTVNATGPGGRGPQAPCGR